MDTDEAVGKGYDSLPPHQESPGRSNPTQQGYGLTLWQFTSKESPGVTVLVDEAFGGRCLDLEGSAFMNVNDTVKMAWGGGPVPFSPLDHVRTEQRGVIVKSDVTLPVPRSLYIIYIMWYIHSVVAAQKQVPKEHQYFRHWQEVHYGCWEGLIEKQEHT